MIKAFVCILLCTSGVFCRGDFAWALWLPSESSSGVGVAADNHGNSFITGNFRGTLVCGSNTLVSTGGSDLFIAKVDRKGNVCWAISAGGTNDDSAYTIAATPSGTLFVTGSFGEDSNLGPSNSLSGNFLARISKHGTVDWVHPLTNVWPRTALLDRKHRVWFAGSESNVLTLSAWNRKGEAAKNVVSDVSGFSPAFLKMDRDGAFYLTGGGYIAAFGTNILSGYKSILTAKLSPSGMSQWADRRTFMSLRGISALTVSSNGSASVYGTADNGYSPGSPGWGGQRNGYPSVSLFGVGYSPSGETGGVSFYGQYKAVYQMGAVTIDRNDQVFQTGQFVSSWAGGTPWYRGAFINGPGFSIVITNTPRFSFGPPYSEGTIGISGIVADANRRVYVTGGFSGSAFFGNNRVGLSSSGPSQTFLARLDLKARKNQ